MGDLSDVLVLFFMLIESSKISEIRNENQVEKVDLIFEAVLLVELLSG